MKCIIIGLGSYGSVLAEELTLLGHEVVGVDVNAANVERIKDKVATSFVLDAIDEQAISILPLKAVDIVVVAIGEAFAASIKVVALLKKFGVEHIYARAVDDLHKTVLEAFDLERVLVPEKEAARSLVQLLDLRVRVESFRVDKDYYVIKFRVPNSLVGYTIEELAVEAEFNLEIVSLLSGKESVSSVGLKVTESRVVEGYDRGYKLSNQDYLVCYGRYRDFLAFWKAIY